MRALALTAALLLGGCSLVNDPSSHMGSTAMDGGVDAGPASIAPNEFCQRFAEFACEAYFDCCPDAPAPTPMDRSECEDAAEFDCTSGFGSLIADSRTGYDPEVAAEVLAEAQAFVRDAPTCDEAIADWYLSRRGFQRVLQGTVAGGGDCTPRSLEPRNPDTAAFFSCESRDQACFFMSADRWICADRQPIGGDCVFYFDCEEGLRCAKGPLTLVGTCEARLADGAIGCNDGTDCQSLICMTSACQPRDDQIFCAIRNGLPGG